VTFGRSNSFGKVVLLTLFILTVLVVVASYLLVLLMGYGFIFFTSEGFTLSMQPFPAYILLFFLIGFWTPIRAGTVFLFIWIVYSLCFIAAWKWRESFHDVIRKSFSRPSRGLFGNFLFIMPLLSSMVLTAVFAMISSQEFVGVPTGQPSFPQDIPVQEIFLNAGYSPVVEELGFRIVPMGLFTMLYVLSAGKNVAGKGLRLLVAALFYPEGAKRIAGLRNVGEHGIWRGINGGEWAMILATSVIFAFAHIITGTGWQVGKVTSVFVQGFFFAITYLAYGFEAPILLHWFFNYYLFFFDPDVVAKFFLTTDPLLQFMELVILGMGGFGWIVFAMAALRKLTRRKTTRPALPTQPPTLPS